jgi:hypothetical protein
LIEDAFLAVFSKWRAFVRGKIAPGSLDAKRIRRQKVFATRTDREPRCASPILTAERFDAILVEEALRSKGSFSRLADPFYAAVLPGAFGLDGFPARLPLAGLLDANGVVAR